MSVQGNCGIDVVGARKTFPGGTTALDDVALRVAPGSIVALLGPSGCGKTTLLRAIAGLETLDAGSIAVGDQTVAAPGVFVAPERRKVGMVFQDWALFPHMTVAKNVGYGLPRAERAGHRVDDALEMVGLAEYGPRMPDTLSGGQKQRVALARALAPAPGALLLDEPFSNLDTTLRVQVRGEVHRLLKSLGITTVFVTHDQAEAFVLGDQVAVMHDGRVEQQAAPSDVYAAPATPWVAQFIGDANLVDGVADGNAARTAFGPIPLQSEHHGDVQVLVRPEALRLATAGEAGGVVELVEYYGHDTVYEVLADDGPRVRVRVAAAPAFARGDRASLSYVGGAAIAYRASS